MCGDKGICESSKFKTATEILKYKWKCGRITMSKLSFKLNLPSICLILLRSESLIIACYETSSISGIKPWMFLCHFQTKHSGFSVTLLKFSGTTTQFSFTKLWHYIVKGRYETVNVLASLKILVAKINMSHIIEETLRKLAWQLRTSIICRNQNFLTKFLCQMAWLAVA